MWYAWMPTLRLKMTLAQWQQLPRNPAYKYEYSDDTALLSPRPLSFHAALDLSAWTPPPADELAGAEVEIRRLQVRDRVRLSEVFTAAFFDIQPFGSMGEQTKTKAARACLRHALSGKDGQLIKEACLTACWRESGAPLGAALVTLIPGGELHQESSYLWNPKKRSPRRAAQPHLTWIFVSPFHKRSGVGAALLAGIVEALRHLGHKSLWSTFIAGNEASLLWHWRHGFRLAPSIHSMRAARRKQPGRLEQPGC